MLQETMLQETSEQFINTSHANQNFLKIEWKVSLTTSTVYNVKIERNNKNASYIKVDVFELTFEDEFYKYIDVSNPDE